MSQLIAMFCDIDDFCKRFAPLSHRHLLQSGQRSRPRRTALTLSDILTLLVYFHWSHYRTFKHDDTEYVEPHLRPYFPTLVRSNRFVEWMPRARVPLPCYLRPRKGRCTGLAFVDSTPLAVCHNRRIRAHRVLAGWATRGKTSMGWFYGFKLHLIGNDEGELLAGCLTPGHIDDRRPVPQRITGLFGQLCGDRGSISPALHDALFAPGLELLTKIRQNIKNRLRRLWDKLLRRKRTLIETIHDQLKNLSQIAHTRHRRVPGCMVKLVAGLVAYTYQPKKPSPWASGVSPCSRCLSGN
jgi:hypothetical protein